MYYKFFSSTCAPCKDLDSWLKEISLDKEVVSIDVAYNANLVAEYGIRSVPTILDISTNEKVVGLPAIKDFLTRVSC